MAFESVDSDLMHAEMGFGPLEPLRFPDRSFSWRMALVALAALASGWRFLMRVSELDRAVRLGLDAKYLIARGPLLALPPAAPTISLADHRETGPLWLSTVAPPQADEADRRPDWGSVPPPSNLTGTADDVVDPWSNRGTVGIAPPNGLIAGAVATPDLLPTPGSSERRGTEARLRRDSGDRPPRASVLTGNRAWALTILVVVALALALRLIRHSTNFDIFVDEISYAAIGRAVALGQGVMLYHRPFFLHPPLFFYLEAGLTDLFGGARDTPVQLILALRPINCVLGAIECGLVMLLVGRVANKRAAVVVGVFEACDPFVLLWDGRVLLETMAMTLAVLGWIALERLARREDQDRPWTLGDRAMVILGGLCFGASLLTKETYGFVGVVPLTAILVLGSPVRRKVSASMLALAVGCYGVYIATVAASGRLSAWSSQQITGVARAIGTKQITGFNQKGHHAGFSSGAGASISLYLITYLVIVAAGLATAAGVLRWFRAARRGEPITRQRRLAIALGAGGVGYVTYAVGFGAFETQIFYMCIVAGLPVLSTETLASVRALSSPRRRRWALIVGLLFAGFALGFALSDDVRLRAEKDSDIPELVSYVDHHLPYGALVDSTDGVTQFVLTDVRIDTPVTLAGLERDKPGYVVVAQGLVDQGYVTLGPGFQRWLDGHARVVFEATGREDGELLSPLLMYRTVYANTHTEVGG